MFRNATSRPPQPSMRRSVLLRSVFLRVLVPGVFARGILLPGILGASLAGPLATSHAQKPIRRQPISQPPIPLRLIDDSASAESRQALASVRYLAGIALRHLPRKFDGDKDWGDTKKVWSGVKMRLEDGRLKTHRRFREVEHGRWIQYEVQLPPAGLTLDESVWIRSVVPVTATDTIHPGYRIEATAVTRASYRVRIQRWARGVRLASVTVEGDLRIRLDATMDVHWGPDYTEIPPAILIDPNITQATLSLEKFRVDRVSKIGGDAAELWGEMVQELFVERLIEKQNDRLVEKLNRGIEKNRDDLRLSTLDWIRKGFSGNP